MTTHAFPAAGRERERRARAFERRNRMGNGDSRGGEARASSSGVEFAHYIERGAFNGEPDANSLLPCESSFAAGITAFTLCRNRLAIDNYNTNIRRRRLINGINTNGPFRRRHRS